ncbi:MAG: hypothetical protein JWO12_756, partial [Frankiales bacterium]|nr:hypothetical protein [Frankiales bacterium]
VYYAASKLLLHGSLPYGDFTIVHPPVVSLVLLPASLLGEVLGDPAGLAAARVLMQVVACLNVLLVYRLALRLGPRQLALVAAALYAVMPNAVIAEHTILLEPRVNLGCLLGVLLLLSKRPVWAGFFIAAACGIKLFAGVYVVAVLIWLVVSKREQVTRFLAGTALGAAVLVLPFALVDLSAFWHDVVITQLSRPEDATDHGFTRIANMVGLGYSPVLVAMALLAIALAVAVVQVRRDPSSPLALWLLVMVLAGAAFATSSSYFPHYGAFLAPPLVLLLSRMLEGWQRWPVAAMAVVFLIGCGVDLADQQGQATLTVPQGRCVYYDAVSLALSADVFEDPSPRCPAWIDGRGVALTRNTDWPADKSFYPAGFVADQRWQAGNVAQMKHADLLLLRSPPASFPEWSAATREYVLAHFTAVWVHARGRQHSELWKRSSAG